MSRKRLFQRAASPLSAFVRRSSFAFVAFALLVNAGFAVAQNPGSHYLHRPSLPTGELASFYRLSGADLTQAQPVAWKLPAGVRAGVAAPGGYVFNAKLGDDARYPWLANAFALQPGRVYRFQLTDIPFHPDRALYPTLEILGRLNPPTGREWYFPIEIDLPQADLELALNGNLVTRVVFVENSENARPTDADRSTANLTVEVPNNYDPVAVAASKGRVVAILRVGSRAPVDLPNADNPFYFGLPPFALAPSSLQPLASTPETFDVVEGPETTAATEAPETSENVETPETLEAAEPTEAEPVAE
ncbi:MAG: hypothetical protein IJE77_08710 [Thermoguttaceae bacterium]|nr:hypothetical protein [Thermoguttaceae bacterium]MBQ9800726.1 hypothetical protein [Thermoguttaceae bacterium]